jgi:hypothetical protein
LPEIFSSLGFDKEQISLLLAVIIGRMAHPWLIPLAARLQLLSGFKGPARSVT